MKDSYVTAKLVEPNLIRLVIFSSLPYSKPFPKLVIDGRETKKLTPLKVSSLPSMAIADFRLDNNLELGHSYFLELPGYGGLPVDVTEATTFPNFDTEYFYGGDDLGATYTRSKTTFAVWAPLASRVNLLYRAPHETAFHTHALVRTEKGVYRGAIHANAEGYCYLYEIVNNEVARKVTDPYGKASTLDGEESVVLDFSRLQVNFNTEALPVLNSPTDAIIYECHVRDMTIDAHSDIKHKGTFKGLTERGRRTDGGHLAGFDYIKSLGITHIQLLPIYDFKSVNEKSPNTTYNWGYDPQQYFVPEGSYASDREDPVSRIVDLKKMVAEFHKEGIRVVMDVVYNHVYEYESSVFEKVVPNYYFRKRGNGTMANTSGCGNDLASERPMVRKLIVDACKFWIDEYGIDGFRFDLMGILDVTTLTLIEEYAKAKDKSFLLYGEGWNMGGEVSEPLGHMGNFQRLPNFGFFNDHFREDAKRYLIGDMSIFGGFKHAFASSCLHFVLPAKFLDARQTINYVECHDNGTFFDYVDSHLPEIALTEKLDLCSLACETVLYSFGIPFIHMGQELGQSKWGDENTYNKGDAYNKFSYSLLDSRYDMYERFRKAVAYRKSKSCLRIYDPRVIDASIDIGEIGNALRVKFIRKEVIAPSENVYIYINPSVNTYEDKILGDYEEEAKVISIPPRSCVIFDE